MCMFSMIEVGVVVWKLSGDRLGLKSIEMDGLSKNAAVCFTHVSAKLLCEV